MKQMTENENHCFCADEAVDTSSSELLPIVDRQVTKVFSVEEHFLGNYTLESIKSEHVVKRVKASSMG